jgi:hypothetical protein
MFASCRRARALAVFAVLVSLGGLSCARGSQSEDEGSSGVAEPMSSARGGTADAAISYASYAAPGDDTSYGATSDDAADNDEAAPVSVPARTVEVDPDIDAGDDAAELDTTDAIDAPSGAAGDGADGLPPNVLLYPAPEPGELAITEVMLSPSGPEPASEWFEIYNRASSPRRLNGLIVEDGDGDTDVIPPAPPVVVAPGTYALLVRDQAAAVQALVPASSVAYAYGAGLPWYEGIELDDGDVGDLSLWNGSTLLADVPYGQWDSSWVGQSIELATPESDASDPSQWCVARSPWAPGSDDGTPGAASDCGP